MLLPEMLSDAYMHKCHNRDQRIRCEKKRTNKDAPRGTFQSIITFSNEGT